MFVDPFGPREERRREGSAMLKSRMAAVPRRDSGLAP
jgi:hypothetical protein